MRMHTWTQDWLLKLHPDKCVSMRVGKTDPPLFTYSLEDHDLEYSACESILTTNLSSTPIST